MNSAVQFPLYSPGRSCETNSNFTMLAADLRMKTSHLALFKSTNGELVIAFEKHYETQAFSSFSELAKAFRADCGEAFTRISIGVPGPVIFGKCETTHLPWNLDVETITKDMDLADVYLINDMEATAYSLADTKNSEVIPIHDSNKVMPGNVAILAPGNGLGEAGLFWDGVTLHPFATEGGHTEFSPRNQFEVEFYKYLNKIYGIVSWENVLSKEGLYNIYRYLRDVGRHPESQELSAQIQSGDFLEVLAHTGKNKSSHLVNLTLEMFAEFLAREANYMALKLKATGGLVITGEIAEKVREFIDKEKFYKDFKISDKMELLLRDIPIYFIFNSQSILHGAAFYGAFIQNRAE